LGGRTAPAEDRFAAQFMYETQGQPPDTPNFVRHWGESAFRGGEDDGIGAFHWLDEGFGHAWRHADRALLFRLAEIVNRQTAPDGARAKLLPAPGKAS
jgi:anti-sigma factor RsiW